MKELLLKTKFILTEGAIVERLKAEFHLKMNPGVNHALMIYQQPAVLKKLYRQYIETAQRFDLPVMIMTPTRRVHVESARQTGFACGKLIEDSCNFLLQVKNSHGSYSHKLLVGGLLGCKSDAYSGERVLNSDEAYYFHKQQADIFGRQKLDFLFAGIMPELQEVIGMARALNETGIPYFISFMIRKNGCLLDGTSIAKAIQTVDKSVSTKPVGYMANCIHPSNLLKALQHPVNKNSPLLKRFIGIQANASAQSPEELNGCIIAEKGDFDEMVSQMVHLRQHYGLKIFGGCCGTNDVFIEKLATGLIKYIQ
ncbi:MAG: homocysteine S-methyltransferase family protein [Bacteroidales bacterium]|nr:homocysteine S-methyltransferase family protein [Bacteroidales bacterium]